MFLCCRFGNAVWKRKETVCHCAPLTGRRRNSVKGNAVKKSEMLHMHIHIHTHTYIYINKVLYSNYCVCMHTYAQLIIRYMYACVIWIAVSLCFIVFRYFHALQHCGKIKPLRLARDQTLSDTDLAPTGVMVQKKQGQVNGMGEGWFGIQRGIECDYIYINWDMAIASIFHYETKLAGLVLTVWLSSIVSK